MAEDAGAYEYLLNDEPAPVRETWSRIARASGEQLLRSSRQAPGVDIEVQAFFSEGLVTSCEVIWRTDAGLSVQADFQMQDDFLQVRRRQGAGLFEREDIPLETAGVYLLSPLMRIYAGPVITRLLEAGGQATVVLPDISEPANPDALLRPQLSTRRARVLDPDARVQLHGDSLACCLCEYSGDQYGEGTRFWLGADDILLRYTWQQSPGQLWDVRLAS